MSVPFHLAFPVDDLERARRFYEGTLGCTVGRESERWIDFAFFGHQISAHLVDEAGTVDHNEVDGELVPVRHFGAVLPLPEWEAMVARLRGAGADFLIAPTVRFAGTAGEQRSFFVRDPAGNALEFKAFADPSRLFAREAGPGPGGPA